jgi:hypothetical protein
VKPEDKFDKCFWKMHYLKKKPVKVFSGGSKLLLRGVFSGEGTCILRMEFPYIDIYTKIIMA